MTPEEMLSYDMKIMSIIEDVGWAVQGVLNDDGSGFAYTVGLSPAGFPEIITFGIPMGIAQPILNELAQRMLNGVMLTAGDVLDNVIRDHPVTFIEVTDSTTHLTMANRLFGWVDGPVWALQLVWPDLDSRFPWDTGYAIDPHVQPLLGDAPA